MADLARTGRSPVNAHVNVSRYVSVYVINQNKFPVSVFLARVILARSSASRLRSVQKRNARRQRFEEIRYTMESIRHERYRW